MKKKSKFLLITAILIALISISTIIIIALITPDKNTTLTAVEKRWIEDNKNTLIDIAILNDVPLLSYEGDGIFYDFLKNFKKDIGLDFNLINYNYKEAPSIEDYKFDIVNKIGDDQILFYEDNYVLISKDKKRILDNSELDNSKIGILPDREEDIKYYLYDTNAEFIKYESIDLLYKALNTDEIKYILIPNVMYLNTIIGSEYNIIYTYNDLVDNYVINLSKDNKTVNTIMKKYLELWKKRDYDKIYNENSNRLYNDINEISSKTIADFVKKDYVYGYINNLPYEDLLNNKLVGINSEFINKFSEVTGVNFKFVEYKNSSDLINAFNNGKVDIMYGNVDKTKLPSGSYNTMSTFNNKYAVLTKITNTKNIINIKSLKDKEVYVQNDSALLKYINNNVSVDTILFNNNKNLFSNLGKAEYIVIDYNTYNYYKNSEFKNYKVEYIDYGDNNNFVIYNKEENKLFIDYFEYYISSLDEDEVYNRAIKNLITNPKNQTLLESIINYILYIIVPILFVIVIILTIFKKNKKKNVVKKDERVKYIDYLTSLKNRNYLNNKLKEWDEAKVYPQTIIILDLNSMKYINDNFGHLEGDKTIKAAANILISTQKENTDIVRTDGNEFLIYLIGYEEKEIISYMKMLYKKCKDLPHGLGASLGYSMITDDMKLIEDAINEATLDMRTNKEN